MIKCIWQNPVFYEQKSLIIKIYWISIIPGAGALIRMFPRQRHLKSGITGFANWKQSNIMKPSLLLACHEQWWVHYEQLMTHWLEFAKAKANKEPNSIIRESREVPKLYSSSKQRQAKTSWRKASQPYLIIKDMGSNFNYTIKNN